MDVSSFNNITFFWFIISVNYFFIYWRGITVIFLTASDAAARRIMSLSDFCVPFSQRKTIGSSVLVTCNSIGAAVWCDIWFIYSALYPEDTWMEAAHAWLFVVKLGGLRAGIYFLQICPWWCCHLTSWRNPMLQPRLSSCGEVKILSSHTLASTHSLTCFRENSVWYLVHYHWAGSWWSPEF